MSKPEDLRERLAALIAEHWPILDCNEGTHEDRTTCSCALHGATWQPTVGQSIKEWAEHLSEQLARPIEAELAERVQDLQQQLKEVKGELQVAIEHELPKQYMEGMAEGARMDLAAHDDKIRREEARFWIDFGGFDLRDITLPDEELEEGACEIKHHLEAIKWANEADGGGK